MVTYGGDEVSAIVIDIGTSTTKAGYAGEEIPKCVIPTSYGYTEFEREVVDGEAKGNGNGNGNGETEIATPMDQDQDPRVDPTASGSSMQVDQNDGGKERSKKVVIEKKYFMGEDGVNVWRKGMQVGNFMMDGIIADPSPLPHHLSHIIHSRLSIDPTEHPLLVSEPAWNTQQAREMVAEVCFEGEGVPGFYIAASPVLSAFSAGKGSALIIDIGSDLCSVVPVTDGYAIRAGTKRQPLSMSLLHAQMASYLSSSLPPSTLTPHQLIKSRKPVQPGQPADVILNQSRVEGTTDSWRNWAEGKVVEGWREAVAEVYVPVIHPGYPIHMLNESQPTGKPTKSYEFPNGYNQAFGDVRFHIPEALFNLASFLKRDLIPPPSLLTTPNSPTSHALNSIVSLSDLITNSILACDVDQRPVLLQNMVVVGGGSLVPGLVDRINLEMGLRFPGSKIKIHSPGNTVERKYSAWLGGSILASLGTFHQLWVAAEEWKEHGPSILRQRCK